MSSTEDDMASRMSLDSHRSGVKSMEHEPEISSRVEVSPQLKSILETYSRTGEGFLDLTDGYVNNSEDARAVCKVLASDRKMTRISFGKGNFVLPHYKTQENHDQDGSSSSPNKKPKKELSSSVKEDLAFGLCRCLRTHPTLTILDFTNFDLGDDGIKLLSGFLENNQCVQQIDLQNNAIGDDGASVLFIALEHNRSLKRLNLSHNMISESTIELKYFLEKSSCPLLELYLDHNQIGPLGTKYLGEILVKNSSLDKLSLMKNVIADLGSGELAEALKKNKSLSELILDNNNFSHIAIIQLAECLTWNRSLTNLSFGADATIADSGLKALLSAMTSNYSVISGIYELGNSSNNKGFQDIKKRNIGLGNQLQNAVREGQLATVIKLLQLRISPLSKTETNSTLLHLAAQVGANKTLVDTLIQAGVHCDLLDSQGETPLEVSKKIPNNPFTDALMRHLTLTQRNEQAQAQEDNSDLEFNWSNSSDGASSDSSIDSVELELLCD